MFAAETLEEMKTWMNVLSLASIAFGTGQASMSKRQSEDVSLVSSEREDIESLQKKAIERAGGVTGDHAIPPVAGSHQEVCTCTRFLSLFSNRGRMCFFLFLSHPSLCLHLSL